MSTKEKNLKDVLNNFNKSEEKNANEDNNLTKKFIIDNRQGLIERVDKVFVTADGRQLLREQY